MVGFKGTQIKLGERIALGIASSNIDLSDGVLLLSSLLLEKNY